jgi:peptidoglycan/LPS O-acetylase OafA/YrhL
MTTALFIPTVNARHNMAYNADLGRKSPSTSIDSLTSLRGFLALWVVGYHFWKDAVALFPAADAATPLVAQGHFAVPVFFILSGFVLAFNYSRQFAGLRIRSYGRFLIMRAARIYPVHLASLLIVLGMVWVCRARGWSLTDAGYEKRDFALNLFLVHTWVPSFHLNWNYPSWSISSEWFAYLLFPFVCTTLLRRVVTRAQAYSFLTLCWIASIALYAFGDTLPFRELLRVIPTFLVGIAIFVCISRNPAQTRLQLRGLPDVLLLSLAAVPFLTSGRVMLGCLLTGFLVLVFLLAKQAYCCTSFWTNRIALYLGEVSYSLYMAHALAQKFCYKLLPADRFANSALGARVAVALAYAACIAIASLAMYYFVEKPSRRRLRQLATRPNPAASAIRHDQFAPAQPQFAAHPSQN